MIGPDDIEPDDPETDEHEEYERLERENYRAMYKEDHEPGICGRLWSPQPRD